MSNNLKYLCQLIEMVEKDSNDHSRKKLWSLISMLAKREMGDIAEKESTLLLSEIHELNMEQYIRVQARHFYDEFPLLEIKDQLILDFIEMEHCRRRDDFEGFALAAFQQLENTITYIFSNNNLWEKAKLKKDTLFFTSVNKDGVLKSYGIQTLGSQLIYVKDVGEKEKENKINNYFLKNQDTVDFVSKFKLVLYFGYFNEVVKTFDEWNQVYNLGYDIYLSRNRNHRGVINTEAQSKKQATISKSKYKYYLLFLGYLADFMQKISSKYSEKI